jgi:hypothetical protein
MERAEVLGKKEHGFHLVLDGASEASAVASPRTSTVLTSSIQTRRIAALTSGELAAAGLAAGAHGIRRLPLHGAGRGRFRGRRRAPRCGTGARPREPFLGLLLRKSQSGGRKERG